MAESFAYCRRDHAGNIAGYVAYGDGVRFTIDPAEARWPSLDAFRAWISERSDMIRMHLDNLGYRFERRG